MNTLEYFEDGYALLIGIEYRHWEKPLSAPLKDIEVMENHFKDEKKASYRPENILTLTESEATANGIFLALEDLAKRVANKPDASVIIYYTGHGGNRGEDYFLVPYDFDLALWDQGKIDKDRVVMAKQFAQKINLIKVKKCLIILDCCHSENIPVEKSLHPTPSFMNGLLNSLDKTMDDFPVQKSISKNIKKGSGRVILTSCEANELSLDLGSLSLFTKKLMDSFNGISNIENDGWVRLIDLIRYVPKSVAEFASKHYNHQQHPVFKRIENLTSEDFIICAYDIRKAKGIDRNPGTSGSHDPYEEAIACVLASSFDLAFKILDLIELHDKFQYNRLRKEFVGGLTGVHLTDFAERLIIFLRVEQKRYKS